MYDSSDTILAVSSAAGAGRAIVRISGARTFEVCGRIFKGAVSQWGSGLFSGSVAIEDGFSVDGRLYVFVGPRSYTCEDVAELHVDTNPAVVEVLVGGLLGMGLRMAGPGEFTARSYLNGKIDLAQAEAVNEVVSSSNRYQLAAAEKLLGGQLSESAEAIRSAVMDCLSLIEAGLDFSGEDIEFITGQEVLARLCEIRKQLEDLLAGGIGYESVVDMPSVGVAGSPNAGKSSLVNTLLGEDRSIVSGERKTTRDVLTGVATLAHCRCVLFDCAGLIVEPAGVLDELAQEAAIEALRKSSVVVFCVDISKDDWGEDFAVRRMVDSGSVIMVATKSDLVCGDAAACRLAELEGLFGASFLPISVVGGRGIDVIREAIDGRLVKFSQQAKLPFSEDFSGFVALTARHRQAVSEAIEHLTEAVDQFAGDKLGAACEVTAMMLRAAYQCLSSIEQPGCVEIDEEILGRIFGSFCIGK
ncbi:MAG: 50S ribosome-binding GTPase [Sedimentisphaerales bacterium]|nr:50S ribosome-binding GTPase [Sedimentisphaerales bacterium]